MTEGISFDSSEAFGVRHEHLYTVGGDLIAMSVYGQTKQRTDVRMKSGRYQCWVRTAGSIIANIA